MRLPNGYGSIYKLSGKRRRPYAAMVTTGWTDEGKPIRKYLGYYEKRQGALDALAEYNTKPYDIDNKKITLADLWDKWKAYRIEHKKSVPASYIAAYKRCSSMHDVSFVDIRSRMIQVAVDACDKPPSAGMIKTVMNILYKYAFLMGICTVNYATPVETPPVPKSTKHHPFSDDELADMWQHTDDLTIRIALILCYTGMRPTELRKMKYADVHLTERYMVGGIKTSSGKNRVIPIAEKIVPIITDLYNHSDKKHLLVDDDGIYISGWKDFYDSVWCKSTFKTIQNHFPHDGRHTCKTRLDNAGVNPTTAKLILGHSSNDVEERVYTHKTTKQLIEAINLI